MQVWQQFVSQLQEELGEEIVEKWLPKLETFDAANIYLKPKDTFQAAWFEEHVRPRLKVLSNNNGRAVKVHLSLQQKTANTQTSPPESPTISPDPLDPHMSFENFVISESNLILYKLLTENSVSFNPIYLYGPSGSGKTHLLQSAARHLMAHRKKVFYVTAQTFTEHVVQAIRQGNMHELRKVYREIDVLIVDGIDLFSRKLATQEEFFHTFNTLHTSGRLILLSAPLPPMQLKEVEERLISRFEWGISLGVTPADTRQILEKKAKCLQLELDTKTYDLLQSLEKPMMALHALVLRSKSKKIDRPVAEQLLKDLLNEKPSLTPEQIVKTVAGHYGVTAEDLLGKSQTREFALPRQIAMYYIREKLKMPYQQIGALFNRDHSTVMSSVKQIAKNLEDKTLEALQFPV